jgi:uncharacterized protein (DUF2384 family)
MVHPVLCGILREWKFVDVIFVDTVTKVEKDAEGSLREDSMCRIRVNVVVGNALCRFGQPVRRQEFLDRKMRELDHRRPVHIDHGDQTGTCR